MIIVSAGHAQNRLNTVPHRWMAIRNQLCFRQLMSRWRDKILWNKWLHQSFVICIISEKGSQMKVRAWMLWKVERRVTRGQIQLITANRRSSLASLSIGDSDWTRLIFMYHGDEDPSRGRLGHDAQNPEDYDTSEWTNSIHIPEDIK